MPTPRKIHDAADAEACLRAVARSELSLRDWAHQHGVDARSLNAWRVNQAQRGRAAAPSSGPRLHLVELVTGAAPAPPLRVLLGDLAIEVPPKFEANHLQRLVEALRGC